MPAAKKLALATYKYNDLDEGVKDLERRVLSREMREKAAYLGVWIKLVLEKQISYKWEF